MTSMCRVLQTALCALQVHEALADSLRWIQQLQEALDQQALHTTAAAHAAAASASAAEGAMQWAERLHQELQVSCMHAN